MYLTRLLSTKGTIKKFIDDFFGTILCCDDSFPPAVKWLFDLFDQAVSPFDDVAGEAVVHSWKSNSVPLRFWINLIKNPDFVFDVEKTPSTDLNLSIVAQTLMSACVLQDESGDTCSPTTLNKESPSHKLLFARDITAYRSQISDFYSRVRGNVPPVSDQDLHAHMNRLSQMHRDEFNQMAALKEVFLYVSQYYHELSMAFNTDSGNGTLVNQGGGGVNGTFVPSPTLSQNTYLPQQVAGTLHHSNAAGAAATNRDLSMKLEHIFKIVKESDYVR